MKQAKLNEADLLTLSQYGLQHINTTYISKLQLVPGEFLSKAGEAMNTLYLVVSGKAKVFISLSDGKELLLTYFTQKGIIGEIELMTNAVTTQTTVQAVTALTCITLPLNRYANELKRNIVFINFIAKDLAEKLAKRVVNSAITTLHPLETRLCAYILQTAVNGVFNEKLTEVCGVMGVSYRHLLRCLAKLCEIGALKKEARAYHLTNRRTLEKAAGDLYILE